MSSEKSCKNHSAGKLVCTIVVLFSIVACCMGIFSSYAKAETDELSPQYAYITANVIDEFDRFVPSDTGYGIWWNHLNATYKVITYENGYNRSEQILSSYPGLSPNLAFTGTWYHIKYIYTVW